MSIINRVVRLFTADLHSVLDSLEEPAVMLKQSVREMEAIIEQGEAELRRLAQQQENLNQRNRRLDQLLATTSEQIDFCFAEQNDPLARSLVGKKLQYEQQQTELLEQQKKLSKQHDEQRVEIDEQQEQLQNILDKLEWLNENEPVDHTTDPQSGSSGHQAVSEEMVELAFLQEKQRRTAGGTS